MSFDWSSFVVLAENLLSNEEESYFRFSMSRAYYGVFCIARNSKGMKEYKGPYVHKAVISKFKDSNDRSERNIGRILDNLRKSRNDSDYNEDIIISKDLAKRRLHQAKQILHIFRIS